MFIKDVIENIQINWKDVLREIYNKHEFKLEGIISYIIIF